jgi:hypothetical protein
MEYMKSRVLSECAEELAERADPTPGVGAATRGMRRFRAEQLDEIQAVVDGASFYAKGFRSPTDWLMVTTREGVGQCKQTLHLAERIQVMPVVKAAFAAGDLAESSLRLLAVAWAPSVSDVFARDEAMLCGWATSMPHSDFKMVLDTWRMHADPDRESATAQERFDSRSLQMSGLLDGMGRVDGLLDPEGFALTREAVRLYSRAAEGDTRTAAQRRADALVTVSRMAIERHVPVSGEKRRTAKVVATIAYDDLVARFREGSGIATEHGLGDGVGVGGTIDTDTDRIVVPAETIRRMACDCNVHRYVTNPLGTVTDFGRSHRVVSDSLFDTLLIRDHGCRWPGCGIPAGGCDAHHAKHWLDLGETKPDNLVLLCWFHHHLLHEQHWSIEPLGGGHFSLNSPTGDAQLLRPPMVGLALPAIPATLPFTNL